MALWTPLFIIATTRGDRKNQNALAFNNTGLVMRFWRPIHEEKKEDYWWREESLLINEGHQLHWFEELFLLNATHEIA